MPLVGPGGRSAPIPRPTAPRAAPPPPPRAPGAPPTHTDVTSGGYNFHAVTAYKATPAYHHAVAQVFKAQPPVQQAKIVQGLVRNNAYRSPEFHAIHQAFASLPAAAKGTIASYAPRETSTFLLAGRFIPPERLDFGKTLGSALGDVGHLLNPSNVYGTGKGRASSAGLPGVGSVTPFAKGTYGAHMVVNAGKDIVNLPAETFSTVGTLASDLGIPAGHANLSKLARDFAGPVVQAAKHPLQALVQHPVDTYLMASGVLHGVTRPLAGAVRTAAPDSALGRSLALSRPPIALTGKLTRERPQFSPYPLVQAAQKIADNIRLEKTGRTLRPRSQAVADRLTAIETSREAGMTERVRRANRDAAVAQRMKAVQPARAVRVAKQAARTLKTGQKPITIPGAEVLGLVPDGTIRSARTAAEDLSKYVKMVSANRPNLLDSPLLKEHDANVAKLHDVITGIRDGKIDPAALVRAGASYAKDYHPVQKEAAGFGHFGSRSEAALAQREMAHYALLHMGAQYDPAAERLLLRGAPVKNEQIRAHMRAGGVDHPTAFTTDKPRPGSAFYVSSERRPLPEQARNTYFAYTHGLTDTSHDALLRQHVRMQGVVDAHKAQNRLVDQLAVRPTGGYWGTFKEAQRELQQRLGHGYQPLRLGHPFHPPESLHQALEGVNPATLDEEAAAHGLDLSARLKDSGPGQYAGISKVALQRLEEHRSQILPNLGQRAFSSLNTQFRRVALSTSAKHVPGVASEQVIRDISSGVGFSSWITGHRIRGVLERTPEGRNVATRLKGGQLAGATEMAQRHFVAERYQGTSLYPWLKRFEKFMQNPGPRQLSTAWRAWTTFAIAGTKRVLEEQHQVADVGKGALRDFGSEHGPFFKALRMTNQMIEDAAKGLHDPAKQRQMRVLTEQIRGRWNDLTPHGQMALMYSPFGLWWMNSLRYLGRAPIDQPVKLGALAAATVGTEKERQASGLDMFSAGHLPLYMQGGIPVGGGRVLAQNYYSPFGVANDPLETASGLIEPWFSSASLAAVGDNWIGKPLTSPSNPKGRQTSNTGQRLAVILNSALSSFIPLYAKAQQVAQGGASAYDSSTLFRPQTKEPGSLAGGFEKIGQPYRLYKNKSASGGSGGASVPGFGSAGGGVSVPGFGSGGNGVAVPGFP